MKTIFKGILFAGIRTKNFEQTCRFYGETLKLPVHNGPGCKMFLLPNGDFIDIFPDDDPDHQHFTTGPVIGFEVDDVVKARKELEKNDITFIGPIHTNKETNTQWAHFQGPDDNIYEITSKIIK